MSVMADGPWANRQTRFRTRMSLVSLTQGAQSVAEFVKAADDVMAKLQGMSEDEKCFWLLRGLQPSLRDRVMFDPHTGKEWTNVADLSAYALNIGADFGARSGGEHLAPTLTVLTALDCLPSVLIRRP